MYHHKRVGAHLALRSAIPTTQQITETRPPEPSNRCRFCEGVTRFELAHSSTGLTPTPTSKKTGGAPRVPLCLRHFGAEAGSSSVRKKLQVPSRSYLKR